MTYDEQKTFDFLTWVHDVDESSLEVEDVCRNDYPDFCDAFISTGYLNNGKEMTEEQIERYCEYFPDLTYELALESIY